MHKGEFMARGGFKEGHDEAIGKGQFANLPQDVKMDLYPKEREPTDEGIDDTMTDVDRLHKKSEGKRKSYISFQK